MKQLPKLRLDAAKTISVAGLTRQIIDVDPTGPRWGQSSPDALPKAGVSRSALLPNGEQIELTASTTETETEFHEASPNHVGYTLDVTPKDVDELAVQVYPPKAIVNLDKPAYGFTDVKEANGQWEATYYQQFDQSQLYSVGELGQRSVLTSTGPGSTVNNRVDPSQANKIYEQISDQIEIIAQDFKHHHNLPKPSVSQ